MFIAHGKSGELRRKGQDSDPFSEKQRASSGASLWGHLQQFSARMRYAVSGPQSSSQPSRLNNLASALWPIHLAEPAQMGSWGTALEARTVPEAAGEASGTGRYQCHGNLRCAVGRSAAWSHPFRRPSVVRRRDRLRGVRTVHLRRILANENPGRQGRSPRRPRDAGLHRDTCTRRRILCHWSVYGTIRSRVIPQSSLRLGFAQPFRR